MSRVAEFEIPEIPAAKLYQHPLPDQLLLSNGIPVWYIENPTVPLMSLNLVFPVGASSDWVGKAGLSSFTAAHLKEGAGGKTAQEISDLIEDLGATITPRVTQDATILSVQVMAHYFERSLDILSDLWLRPEFKESEFLRLKQIALNALRQRSDAPESVARVAGLRSYFPAGHPYALTPDGTMRTVESIALEDIRGRYLEQFRVGDAAFIAVGSLGVETVHRMLEERFGGLERGARSAGVSVLDFEPPGRQLVIVDKPGAPQTVIHIYQPAVKAPSLDTLPWQFVNIPFGGSFTSRLMQNIREDKGYSYGVSSAVIPMKHAGVLICAASVATEVTGAALKEFAHELLALPKGNFSAEEFLRARETWKSELVQSFETQTGVLNTITGLYLNGKPLSAINDFARLLETYSLEEFNGVARSFPTFDQATIVLVGDKGAILDQVSEFGEPRFLDSEGETLR